jgi:hypothetical protein
MSGIDVGEAIEIPADVRELIESKRQDIHYLAYRWEAWQDQVLREYWPVRKEKGLTVNAMVSVLSSRGKPVTVNTVRKRLYQLGL